MQALLGFLMGACLAAGTWFAPAEPAPPADLPLDNPEVRYQFAKNLDLKAQISLPPGETFTPETAVVYLHLAGAPEPLQEGAMLQPGNGPGIWRISYVRDLSAQPLPVFSEVTYWYALGDASGKTLATEKQSFLYEDNRKTWQGLAAPPFRIFWYEGSKSSGEEILLVAQAGLKRAQELLALTAPAEVRIYAYHDSVEMLSVLSAGSPQSPGTEQIDPGRGVIIVSAPPGAEMSQDMPRQIPHALMSILLSHHLGEQYRNQPAWLVEGLAEISEPYPDPNEAELLQTAYTRGTLIPMDALCRTIPQKTSASALAAAQVSSFVEFLFRRYGSQGVTKLLDTYRSGEECERGVSLAFGTSLSELEGAWQEDVFRPVTPPSQRRITSPWIFLMILLILTPIGILALRAGQSRKTGS